MKDDLLLQDNYVDL